MTASSYWHTTKAYASTYRQLPQRHVCHPDGSCLNGSCLTGALWAHMHPWQMEHKHLTVWYSDKNVSYLCEGHIYIYCLHYPVTKQQKAPTFLGPDMVENENRCTDFRFCLVLQCGMVLNNVPDTFAWSWFYCFLFCLFFVFAGSSMSCDKNWYQRGFNYDMGVEMWKRKEYPEM